MLLLLGFFWVPMVLADPTEMTINNYIVVVDESRTLKSIRRTEKSTDELDLSSLSLRELGADVFHNLENLKSLNLANNSLQFVPGFAFANLTRLECLSLADNEIRYFSNAFAGLTNLKTLNVSNNLMSNVQRGCFYGLTKSTDILIRNNSVGLIDTDAFERNDGFFGPIRRIRSSDAEDDVREGKRDPIELEIATYNPFLSEPLHLKACVENGHVSVVENIEIGEKPSANCDVIDVEYSDQVLSLTALNITTFDQGWYRLKTKQGPRITSVVLDRNDVKRLTGSLLNDLPANVRLVSLVGNKIQRLERGIIVNRHIEMLDLSLNSINTIEDGVFENMRLRRLLLTGNRLKDVKFLANLPASLTLLQLDSNGIAELTANAFSKLVNVEHLHLAGNDIASLKKDALQGLSALRLLDLSENRISSIETGSFRHLRFLEELLLHNNSISSLDRGLFNDAQQPALTLDLSANKFTKISKDTLPVLPARLTILYLGGNNIRSLDVGSFVKVPTRHLSLDANNISTIARGSFDLPELSTLFLSGNRLSNVDGDAFEGLGRLEFLTLAKNGIEKINKGAMKNLGSLHTLDIRGNPVNKKLCNGALFGLSKSPLSHVTLTEGSLEILQGGLFDDA